MADHLHITDSRTDNRYDLPIEQGAVHAMDLRGIKRDEADFGIMSFDPAFKNTASCRSRVTYIDGGNGVLRYRGYPIEELAEHSSHLETAYLLIHGELPTQAQLEEWTQEVMDHSMLHENAKHLLEGFHHDASPMGVLVSTIAAQSTFYPEAKNIEEAETVEKQIQRIIGKIPTIAAYSLRRRLGWPYVYPDTDLSYAGNFLNMLLKRNEQKYEPNPVFEKALDLIFLLHADHEQNCSATTMRAVGSSGADPYLATAGAAAALSGPLHGGANERVLGQLRALGTKDKVPDLIDRVKKGETKLMGFGHRVYKNYDPRAKILKSMADRVFEETGRSPLIDIALELERIALEDDYFVERKLYPNVDFYSGIVLDAMGFPSDEFTVLFAISRSVGWLAQWKELLGDREQKIARPRQLYEGAGERRYVPVRDRG